MGRNNSQSASMDIIITDCDTLAVGDKISI